MTKGDMYHKQILKKVLIDGNLDQNPRPHWKDGTPAHTYSFNHFLCKYDQQKNESPLITLRPIAIKYAIGELLWIYQDQSNDLKVLKEKYGVTWWDEWDIGDGTIGSCYGETVRRHNLIDNLLRGIQENPDGRRHILSLWQDEDFNEPHGLKPCCFQSIFNVVHTKDKDLLDMVLTIRSSDFATAGCINQIQYLVLHYLVARHCGYEPGQFSVFFDNIQIYDRHMKNAKELISRSPIYHANPRIKLNPDKTNFYDFTVDDIQIVGYPREEIKKKNPQLKFELAI